MFALLKLIRAIAKLYALRNPMNPTAAIIWDLVSGDWLPIDKKGRVVRKGAKLDTEDPTI